MFSARKDVTEASQHVCCGGLGWVPRGTLPVDYSSASSSDSRKISQLHL